MNKIKDLFTVQVKFRIKYRSGKIEDVMRPVFTPYIVTLPHHILKEALKLHTNDTLEVTCGGYGYKWLR